MRDTSPEVNEMLYQRLMALDGEERLKMGFSMLASAKKLILASLPQGLSEAEQKCRLYERLYEEEIPAELKRRIVASCS